jgi:hypothetical protein
MEREIPDVQVRRIAYNCYNFFRYMSHYFDAQDEKTVILRGKRYRRIRYKDPREMSDVGLSQEELAEYNARETACHDCGVIKGELHLSSCDFERCPRCRGQYAGCSCLFEEDEYRNHSPTGTTRIVPRKCRRLRHRCLARDRASF